MPFIPNVIKIDTNWAVQIPRCLKNTLSKLWLPYSALYTLGLHKKPHVVVMVI